MEQTTLIKSVLEKEARDRQGSRNDIKEIFPECSNGKTRDKLGELAKKHNMNQCPVCSHKHTRGISYLLTGPDSIKFLSRFYEIPEPDLIHHRDHCMEQEGNR